MRKTVQSLGIVMLLAFSVQVSAQRYLSEIFSSVNITNDVVYGQNLTVITGAPAMSDLKMDIYQPVGDVFTKRPLIILSHTGSFLPPVINGQATGSRKDSTIVEMAKQFARRGYVAAVMSNRLGWNPTSTDQDVRTNTLINAAYRGIQDMRSCVRYFRKSVAEMNNSYGIDSSFIVAGGIGTGGYISFGAATLNKASELNLTKFINATTGQPYVIPAVNGNFDGTDSTALSRPNHVGYSSRISMAFNLGGALGDSSWLEAGEPPMVGFHTTKDPFAPYTYGAVIVPTTGDFVVNVSGTYDALRRANYLGNNDAMAAAVATLTDPYTLAANAKNNGNEGLYPIVTPAPGAPLSCTGAGANPQIEQGSPWDWWDEAGYIAAANAAGQPGTVVNCLQLRGNPDMSAAKGRTYIDSVMAYLNPRIIGTLSLSSTSIDKGEINQNFLVFPNPAKTEAILKSIGSELITEVSVFDVTGKMVATETGLNSKEYTLKRNNLSAGLYHVRIQFKNSQGFSKVVFE